ncbi:MAG: DUF3795 domain-containing protein [Bacteroidales bacterium]|jgi:hypothetical protein|nr:DUF3795 domain-containing protein [Bacteroidales bacterium]
MNPESRISLIAPCGIDCSICELYLCKDDKNLLDRLLSKGIPASVLPCKGCRNIDGNCPIMGKSCETYTCVQQKKHHYCFECDDFPCKNLHPAADRADILPHNMKIFNLCEIKRIGATAFSEKSIENKKRYYMGKMVLGSGPVI